MIFNRICRNKNHEIDRKFQNIFSRVVGFLISPEGYPQRQRFRSWYTLYNDPLRLEIRLVVEKLFNFDILMFLWCPLRVTPRGLPPKILSEGWKLWCPNMLKKKYYKTQRHLYLESYIFTKLLNIVWIEKHISAYLMFQMCLKVMNREFFDFVAFLYFLEFSDIIKLSQIKCLIDINTKICQHAGCDCTLTNYFLI